MLPSPRVHIAPPPPPVGSLNPTCSKCTRLPVLILPPDSSSRPPRTTYLDSPSTAPGSLDRAKISPRRFSLLSSSSCLP
ncbi:hypothetical protein CH63R_05014 [Colletotrichum higginsianum IMI 349063]|uniref:Uncharacterized protein n=1 Tax=Colletotrichum higginsianum (strain IMI 349063) TaxID=759273 RepID=A0A1B7YLD9_COLHI|nr:hypothetical protein CH63R_05014 [Colletotrichum higginsianum IMI 349063]OBR12718.1 hypothetical protein CH63R_05014 [Colletotrichum higginsianum IMI 349063]